MASIVRPLVYESSFNEIIPVEDFALGRAFVQAYGCPPRMNPSSTCRAGAGEPTSSSIWASYTSRAKSSESANDNATTITEPGTITIETSRRHRYRSRYRL